MAKKKLIPSYEVSLGEDAGTGKGAIQNIYDTIDDSKISFYEQVERLRQVKTPAGITLYDVMKRFVSKLNDDTVAGVLSFDKGIKSKNFDDGFMGRGFSLQTNEIGEGVLEVDRIHARKEIITDVLTHNKINAIGGTLVVSAAYAEVTRVEVGEDFIKCYYKSDAGGEQMWVEGDIIKLQTGQSRNLTSIVYSVSSEADIYGEHWIEFIFDGVGNVGNSIPIEGDTLVQFGNFDLGAHPERGNIIIIGIGDAVNSYPYVEQYRGVDSFDLTGKLITRISDDVYFGAADQSSYMWWNKDKDNQLKIKGALNVSQSGSLFPTIVFRGAYNSGTTYYKGDVVTHNGTSYIYIYDSPSSNKDPEIATSYWTVFVNSGQSAINNAIVYLYKRSITDVTDTDDIDPALEYNFITGKFSGGSIGTWQYAPYSGGGKLYVTSVFVSADTSVTTVTEPFKTPFEFGHDGDDGRGISSITEQFCLSYSKNAAIGTWVNTQPAWQPLMYMWRRQVITYDDDSVVPSAAYLDSSWSVIDNMKIGGDNLSFQNEYDLDAESNNNLYAIIKGENSVTPNIDNVLKNDTEYVLYIGKANKTSGSAVSFQIVLFDFVTNTNYWSETCSFLDEEFFINIKTPETGKLSLLIYAGMAGATAGNKVTYSNVMLQEGNKATEYNPAYRYLTTALQGDTDITGGIVATNLLMMKDTDGGVTAGMSGIRNDNVAFWAGGGYDEAQNDEASIILKKDGSGHLANGNINWDVSGVLNILASIIASSGRIANFDIIGNSLMGQTINFAEESIETLANLKTSHTDSINYQSSWDKNYMGAASLDFAKAYTQNLTITRDATLSFKAQVTVDDDIPSGGYNISIFDSSNKRVWYNAGSGSLSLTSFALNLPAGTYSIHAEVTGFKNIGETYNTLAKIQGNITSTVITAASFVEKTKIGNDGFYSFWDASTYFYFSKTYGLHIAMGVFEFKITPLSGIEYKTATGWKNLN